MIKEREAKGDQPSENHKTVRPPIYFHACSSKTSTKYSKYKYMYPMYFNLYDIILLEVPPSLSRRALLRVRTTTRNPSHLAGINCDNGLSQSTNSTSAMLVMVMMGQSHFYQFTDLSLIISSLTFMAASLSTSSSTTTFAMITIITPTSSDPSSTFSPPPVGGE